MNSKMSVNSATFVWSKIINKAKNIFPTERMNDEWWKMFSICQIHSRYHINYLHLGAISSCCTFYFLDRLAESFSISVFPFLFVARFCLDRNRSSVHQFTNLFFLSQIISSLICSFYLKLPLQQFVLFILNYHFISLLLLPQIITTQIHQTGCLFNLIFGTVPISMRCHFTLMKSYFLLSSHLSINLQHRIFALWKKCLENFRNLGEKFIYTFFFKWMYNFIKTSKRLYKAIKLLFFKIDILRQFSIL